MPDRSNIDAANLAVLRVLKENGDGLATPHEVDHFAYFPTRDGQARFVDACLAAGFRLRCARDPDEVCTEFSAIVWHVDVPGEEAWDKITGMLIDSAEAAGGKYDGWETQLIAPRRRRRA